jgi:hypothetical protein
LVSSYIWNLSYVSSRGPFLPMYNRFIIFCIINKEYRIQILYNIHDHSFNSFSIFLRSTQIRYL